MTAPGRAARRAAGGRRAAGSRRRRRTVTAAIVAGGVAVAVAVAVLGGAPRRDTMTLIALALLGAAVAIGVVALLTRGRSGIGAQAAAVALAAVAATTAGVVLGARAMFISAHDLTALGIIVATSTGAGLAVAWRLGSRIDDDVAALTDMSDRLARGEDPGLPDLGLAELDRLGRDLQRMARRLESAHSRELALERSRRELVAWVSHDLRSPLAGIRAMAEAIEDGVVDDPDDVRRYTRSIGEETERLARLVDDLFELSRVSSGAVQLRAGDVHLDDIVWGCVEAATPSARSGGVSLDVPPPPALAALPAVRAAENETGRILRNLLDNAVRHTPEGGTVRVEVVDRGPTVALSVVDQCGGIPPDDLDRVFDVAFRGDTARRRDAAGGGLGLAIAKGLTEAQDGSIAVANHRGGCSFTVELPVAAAAG